MHASFAQIFTLRISQDFVLLQMPSSVLEYAQKLYALHTVVVFAATVNGIMVALLIAASVTDVMQHPLVCLGDEYIQLAKNSQQSMDATHGMLLALLL